MLERITPGIDKFYVACGKTDMRMGINGLVNKITTEFKLEPCENSAVKRVNLLTLKTSKS
ncbi:IS66 family insertion sequence element accessory protein TnpB [Ruminobacter sp. RM87]|uniref:IS66 family insertion sequence element accessory protein TnpB n=1 Tax=Ruminobacter sp. RM87 TaxID=1200567 RepID=UPI0004E196E0